MKKSQLVIAAVVLLALGVGGFAAYRHFAGPRDPGAQSAASTEADAPVSAAAPAAPATSRPATTAGERKTEPTTAQTPAEPAVTREGLERFLSALTRGWFAFDGSYDREDPDLAEVLRFAFMYVRTNAPDRVTEAELDGMQYLSIPADALQETARAMFDLELPREDLGAFLWRDGAYMMPAAGGLPGGGQARVRSFDRDGERVEVSFTIGEGDDMTGTGNAVLAGADGAYRVIEYAANSVG